MAMTVSTKLFVSRYWANDGTYILADEASTLAAAAPRANEPFLLVSHVTGATVPMVPTDTIIIRGEVIEWRWGGVLPDGRFVTVYVGND